MLRRYFTLEEANAVIPQVAPVVERILQLHMLLRNSIRTLQENGIVVDMATLNAAPSQEADDGPLTHAKAVYVTMMAAVAEVEQLGGELKGLEQGLVDFWSLLDGEAEVLLCWKLGEARIEYYHRPELGFAGRQPVQGRAFLASRRSTVQ